MYLLPEKELIEMKKPYNDPSENYDIEVVAQICHEMNRRFSELNNLPVRPTWDELSNFDKEFFVQAVRGLKEDPNRSPALNHDQWCKAKLAQGWTYGPHQDEDRKTHPCLVLYNDLPRNQRVKDSLFITLVKGYLC